MTCFDCWWLLELLICDCLDFYLLYDIIFLCRIGIGSDDHLNCVNVISKLSHILVKGVIDSTVTIT